MNDHIGASSPNGGSNSSPQDNNEVLQPAVVDYVVQVLPVDNPLGLKELQYQRIYQVWKVLVDQDGNVLQALAMLSSTIMDVRYMVN